MAEDTFFTEAAESEREEKTQTAYVTAANVCNASDTVVPISMAEESRKYNQGLVAKIAVLGMTVEQYAAKKMHYRSVDDLCYDPEKVDSAGKKIVRFSAEQIDAIATAIYNHENGDNSIIIADQAGQGKGRQAAGIIRYAILELGVVPIFFTEKKHLVNDIFRDLIEIGFDTGVPIEYKKKKEETKEYTEEEIIEIIKKEIKDTEDVSVDYEIPEEFDINDLLKEDIEDESLASQCDEIWQGLIDAYQQKAIEEGLSIEYVENVNYLNEIHAAERKGKMRLRPFCPNLIDVKDRNGNILYRATQKKETFSIYQLKDGKDTQDADIKKMILPAEYKLIVAPYSQVQLLYAKGQKFKKNKIVFFEKSAQGSVLVLDESHNAAGGAKVKETGEIELTNRGKVIFQMVKNSKMTTYLSATFAKRPDNMPLYALRTSIRESGLSEKDMIDVFNRGGNAIQEAVSSELARNGQLLRREKQIQGNTEYKSESEDSEIGRTQIARLEKISALYAEVIEFDKSVRKAIKEFNKIKNGKEKDQYPQYKPARTINALAFQMFGFMLLGMKANQAASEAIEKLSRGVKTIVAIAGTMESALNNMSKSFLTNRNEDTYKIGDEIRNDFALYMAYLLNKTMKYNLEDVKVDEKGNKEKSTKVINILDVNDECASFVKHDKQCLENYKAVLASLLSAQTGIPISPIDIIKRRISQAGFVVEEVTGRQRMVVFSEENTERGTIAKRVVPRTDETILKFNQNNIDCLILNQTGATGVSMHAYPNGDTNIVYQNTLDEEGKATIEHPPISLENKKEVKKRGMVVMQMELDINKEVQKLGRINRNGQVYQPEYTYIISAIPSEARLAALMEKKLRSLSANVSGSQTQASHLFTSDDLLSDMAAEPFNETLDAIGFRTEEKAPIGEGKGGKKVIYDFTKKMYFKPYTMQKDFYDTFSSKLNEHIKTLKAQGLYVGQLSYKNYGAETLMRLPFYLGDNDSKTSFGGHCFIEKCNVKLFREKFTEGKIKQQILDKLVIKGAGRNGDDLQFSKIEDFKKEASEQLDAYQISKNAYEDKSIEVSVKDKEHYQKQLETAMSGKEKFSQIESAVALEQELKTLNEERTKASQEIASLALKGDFDSMKVLTEKMPAWNKREQEINMLLEPLTEILKQKSELKQLMREINEFQEAINKTERAIASREDKKVKYAKIVKRAKEYIARIGSICDLSVFKEAAVYGDNLQEPESISYTQEFRKPVVFTGVSFPDYYDDLTAGTFEIHLSGVSETFNSYNLYNIGREFVSEGKITGHVNELITTHKNYEGEWNKISGKHDASYSEKKYILLGSILKTFALGKNNGLAGTIIKYNTIDNKSRVGIEIIDNETDDGKSTYKMLEERYGSEETPVSYPVYYDGNPKNIQKFILEYVYWYLLGQTYELIESNSEPNETNEPNALRYRTNRFIFQIASKEILLLIIEPSSELMTESLNIAKEYYNEKKKDIVFSKKEFHVFAEELSVKLVSTISTMNSFAYALQEEVKIPVTPENYTTTGKTPFNARVSTWYGRNLDTIHPGSGSLFNYFMPTDLSKLSQIYQSGRDGGLSYSAQLKLSYSEFSKLMNFFNSVNRKPTFTIASKYFDKQKGDYTLDALDIENETISEAATVLSDDAIFNENILSDVNRMIDELVNLLIQE